MFAPTAGANPRLRILLETDAPYMVPTPIYKAPAFSAADARGKRLPLSHPGMVPWTAGFVAKLLPAAGQWSAERVLSVSRENARIMYGV
jgi:TatD DNase family protein